MFLPVARAEQIMTAKEAIAVLQEERDHVNHHLGYEGKAEEYYEEMRKISDALGVAISATGKQDAMKVLNAEWPCKDFGVADCPVCGCEVRSFEQHCPGCGQKLDWDAKEADDA